jgi:glycerophosphoryl diester phosphodiesterase
LRRKPLNMAHRGFKAAAPENTMIAFEMAWKAGADGIELDVQMTRDGQLVIIHDETIDRTTDGTGWVKDLDYQELCQKDAGSWFDRTFQGERIPLLSDVLRWAGSHAIFVNIELKTTKVNYTGIEQRVIDLVTEYGMKDQVLVSSFNHFSLRTIKQIDRTVKIGLLYETPLVDPWIYAKRMDAVAIHPHFTNVNEELMHGCNENGILVNPYTINEMDDLQRMINFGVNSIITNHPDRLIKLLHD